MKKIRFSYAIGASVANSTLTFQQKYAFGSPFALRKGFRR